MKKNNTDYIQRKYIYIIIAFALAAFFVTWIFSTFFWSGEQFFYQFHISQMSQTKKNLPKEKIIFVLAGERSLQEIPAWPFPREVYAKTIEKASAAKTIALDVMFYAPSNEQDDLLLSKAIEEHGNIVLLNFIDSDEKTSMQPYDLFDEYASKKGYVNYYADADHVLRKYPLMIDDTIDQKKALYPSFVYSILRAHGYTMTLDEKNHTVGIQKQDDYMNKQMVQLDDQYRFFIQDIPKENLEIYELADVYNGKIPAETFEDAIVLISISAHGTASYSHTANDYVAEPLLMGYSINSLLSGFNPLEASPLFNALISALFFLLCALLTLKIPIAKYLSFLVPLVLCVFAFGISFLLFRSNVIYIYSFGPIFWTIVGYFVAMIIKLVDLSKNVGVIKIPIAQIFRLENLQNTNLQEYLRELGHAIEKDTGISIVEPVITKQHEIFNLVDPNDLEKIAGNGIIMIPHKTQQRYEKYVLVSHINLEGETERYYTLLGMERTVANQVLYSMAALIMACALYFKAIQKSMDREELFLGLIECMVGAIDAKDPITAGHSQRVASIAVKIGEKLGLSKKELEELQLAGIIHDIGKIGIEDRVLNKAGVFTAQEFSLMKEHPKKGAHIMKPAHLSENIIDGILNHHERLDGKGYPSGLKESKLGLFAKIIKIADVYDALVSDRQYKKAWSVEKACDTLYRGMDSEFDRSTVEVFLKYFAPKSWLPPESEVVEQEMDANLAKELLQYTMKLSDTADLFFEQKQATVVPYQKQLDFKDLRRFAGIEWGEFFGTPEFLTQVPTLIGYTPQNDCYYYAFSSNVPPVSQIVYCFMHKNLASGMLTLDSDQKETFIAQYGQPDYELDGAAFWDKGTIYIVLYEPLQKDDVHKLLYLTKYAFGEKESL